MNIAELSTTKVATFRDGALQVATLMGLLEAMTKDELAATFEGPLVALLNEGRVVLPPRCPSCGKENPLLVTRRYSDLVFKDGRWHSEELETAVVCQNCAGELDPDELDKMLVPSEFR